MKARLELFLTDQHVPDTDPACWSITLQIAKAFPFDLIWLNGDYMDFKSVSRFSIKPEERYRFKEDVVLGKKSLQEIRSAAPKARIIFREGNHDRRLQSYITENADRLYGLEDMSLQSLLGLKELGIEYLGGDDRTKVGELYHIHGDEIPTGRIYPARAALARVHANVIFGHIHRFSVAYERSFQGRDHVAWSIGCLERLKVDYDYWPEWQNGLGIIDYTPSGLFNVNPVVIFQDGNRKKAIVGSNLFTASLGK